VSNRILFTYLVLRHAALSSQSWTVVHPRFVSGCGLGARSSLGKPFQSCRIRTDDEMSRHVWKFQSLTRFLS
jgi:hypothetical protein